MSPICREGVIAPSFVGNMTAAASKNLSSASVGSLRKRVSGGVFGTSGSEALSWVGSAHDIRTSTLPLARTTRTSSTGISREAGSSVSYKGGVRFRLILRGET